MERVMCDTVLLFSCQFLDPHHKVADKWVKDECGLSLMGLLIIKLGQLKMFLNKYLHFDVFKETSLRGL